MNEHRNTWRARRLLVRSCVAATFAATLFALSSAHAAPITPGAKNSPTKRHIVIVGVNQSFHPDVQPLSYADDDAARYARVLGDGSASLAVFSVLDAQTQRAYPEVAKRSRTPRKDDFLRYLDQLFERMQSEPSSEFIFIYTGHGAVGEDGEGFITFRDGRLTRTELFAEVIRPSPARLNHIVIDACSAYNLLNRGETTAVQSLRDLLNRSTLESSPNTGVLLATSRNVATHEWSEIQGGVFSHEVLSALSGAADVDHDGDLSYAEIGAFVEAANQKVDDRRAKLDIYLRPPQIDIHASFWQQAKSVAPQIVIAQAEVGLFRVIDNTGSLVTQVNKNGEQALFITLRGTAPYVVSLDDDERLLADPPQQQFAFRDLPVNDTSVTARSALESALRRGLFRVPFGRSYVEGYRARLEHDLETPPSTSRPHSSAQTQPANPNGEKTSALAGFIWAWAGIGTGAIVLAVASTAVAAVSAGFYGVSLAAVTDEQATFSTERKNQITLEGDIGLGIAITGTALAAVSVIAAGTGFTVAWALSPDE